MSEETSTAVLPKQKAKAITAAPNRYINIKTDFSFQYIFGSESRKSLLIDLLNSIFKGRKVITDLVYNNPSHKGMRKENRKTVFDVYCTSNKGEKFIVEIQQASHRFFKDRIIYYAANLIREQGKSVAPDWNYKLPKIYVVVLMDFCFDNSHPQQYLHDVRLIDQHTKTVFYDKLRYIFAELPKFKKTDKELKTKEDQWLYSLKNIEKLPEIPLSLRNKKVFKELYHLAELINLTPEQMNAYQQSLKIKRDNYSVIETAEWRGEKRATQRERAKAEKEKKEMAVKLALDMLAENEPFDKIARYTSLTLKEIQAL
jgi:predicted transposase/invertase (TIGR01784 family)